MFWRKRATVDSEVESWVLDTWLWLDSVLGPVDEGGGRELILPSAKRFPDVQKSGHDRALHYFSLVRNYCGMEEWPCDLVAQDARPGLGMNPVFGEMSTSGAEGTFQAQSDAVVITYNPGLLDDPVKLVATFVHELSHYLLLSQPSEPPGGPDLEELATDLATVHLGFGLFGANAAFSFVANNQGWSSSRSGYLSEATWCFANALFMELRAIEPDVYARYVKSSVASQIAKNRDYLQSMPQIIDRLRAGGAANTPR